MNGWMEKSFLEGLVYMECEELGGNGRTEVCTYSWTVFFWMSWEARGCLRIADECVFALYPGRAFIAIGRFYIAILLPL